MSCPSLTILIKRTISFSDSPFLSATNNLIELVPQINACKPSFAPPLLFKILLLLLIFLLLILLIAFLTIMLLKTYILNKCSDIKSVFIVLLPRKLIPKHSFTLNNLRSVTTLTPNPPLDLFRYPHSRYVLIMRANILHDLAFPRQMFFL